MKKSVFQAIMIWLSAVTGLPAGEIEIYDLESPYQNGKQEIRVLLPDDYAADHPCRVLYVLPVSKGDFGGFDTLREMNAHNEYHLILVAPGFDKTPWFGDHATDPKIRQAGYMKEFVCPFIESRYSTFHGPEGRFLLGFSKSGWGAFSLIFKYPDYFGYAAAWDAPMMLTGFYFGMEDVFGTLDQLNQYRPDLLAVQQKRFFQPRTRLVLTGEKLWGRMIPAPDGGSHTADMHELLLKEEIPHVYDDTLSADHRWDPAWMTPTLRKLMETAEGTVNNQ